MTGRGSPVAVGDQQVTTGHVVRADWGTRVQSLKEAGEKANGCGTLCELEKPALQLRVEDVTAGGVSRCGGEDVSNFKTLN